MLNDFLTQLKKELMNNGTDDIENIMDFIQEIINDRLDNGENLEDIIRSLGDPKQIASSFDPQEAPSEKKEETVDRANEKKVLEFEDVNSIDIENVSYSYRITAHDSDATTVEYEDSESCHLNISCRNGKLSIEQEWDYDFRSIFGKRIFSGGKAGYVNIGIPRSIAANIDLENVSGSISVYDIDCGKTELESVSGKIDLKNVSCTSLEAESVSGSIRLSNIVSDRSVALEAVSGSIICDDLKCDRISAETVSGSIDLAINGNEDDYSINIDRLMNSRKIKGNGTSILTMETVSGGTNYRFI